MLFGFGVPKSGKDSAVSSRHANRPGERSRGGCCTSTLEWDALSLRDSQRRANDVGEDRLSTFVGKGLLDEQIDR